ncbi:hypothetical protein B0H11DRAFT_2226676 [Mycena galericulata]|nr:hypothetical protein B0H11DRAFT_2226676 [Mycena galericulata]
MSIKGTGQTRLLRVVQALGCSVDDWGSESKGKDKGIQKAGEWENVKSKGKGKQNVEAYELELDYLTSSIGTYSVPCSGSRYSVSVLARARRRCAVYLDRAQKRFITLPASQIPAHGLTRVIYPTVATVRGTVLGEARRGRRALDILPARTMGQEDRGLDRGSGDGAADARCEESEWGCRDAYEGGFAACFPPLLPRVSSARMILGTLRCASAQDDDTKNETESEGEGDAAGRPLRRPHAWFYVGSHNVSVGAWGAPSAGVVNYELGFVVVLRLEKPEDVDAAGKYTIPLPVDGDSFK